MWITFDSIMKYHRGNLSIYNELKTRINHIIPFIGAGLSAFVYGDWQRLLISLCNVINNRAKRDYILGLINNEQMETAADEIYQALGAFDFFEHLRRLHATDQLDRPDIKSKLKQEAVDVLPSLFRDLLITTNFDQVLETVYARHELVLRPAIPRNGTLCTRASQGQIKGIVIKVHGDIDSEKDDIVFTGESYNRQYANNTKLIEKLKNEVHNHSFLFLGSSLKHDRFLEILKRQQILEPGQVHYTIMNGTEDLDGRARELGEQYGIRTIFYPDGQHEAVRIILEKLLDDIDHEAFIKLNRHLNTPIGKMPGSKFDFKQENTEFFGRIEEIQKLNEFLTSSMYGIMWWAITGECGCGKSRLALEFQKQIGPEWSVVNVSSADLESLRSHTKQIRSDTLFIIDSVYTYVQDVGHWINEINNELHTNRIRILIIERNETARGVIKPGESVDQKEVKKDDFFYRKEFMEPFTHSKQPSWMYLMQQYNDIYITSSRYKEETLQLKPLSDNDLLSIIHSYATSQDSKLSNHAAADLLTKLKEIDPDLERPLFAMFLVDADIAGNNPTSWDKAEVLDYVLARELDRYDAPIAKLLAKEQYKQSIYDAIHTLIAVACMIDGLNLNEEAEEYCPEEYALLIEHCGNQQDTIEFLRNAGIADFSGYISPVQPDLIGEYYVLVKLIFTGAYNTSEKERYLYSLFQRILQKEPLRLMRFLDRIIVDYNNVLEHAQYIYDIIIKLYGDITTDDADVMQSYFLSLYNLTVTSSGDQALKAAEILSEYEGIVEILYVKALANISHKQSISNSTIDFIHSELDRIALSWSESDELAIHYIKALLEFVSDHSYDELAIITTLIKKINLYLPDSIDISTEYIKGLIELLHSSKDSIHISDTFRRIEVLYKKWSNVETIAIQYTKALYTLSYTQTKSVEIKATCDQLKTMTSLWPTNVDIAEFYSQALINLVFIQMHGNDFSGAERSFRHIEKVYQSWSENEQIGESYSGGIAVISSFSSIEICSSRQAVDYIDAISKQWPDNESIATSLSMVFVNLLNDQTDSIKTGIDKINQMSMILYGYSIRWPDNNIISFAYADVALREISLLYISQGVRNPNKELFSKLEKLLYTIEEFSTQWPNDQRLYFHLTTCLLLVAALQTNQDNTKVMIARVGEISEKWPDNIDIITNYVNGLGLLILDSSEKQEDTLERIDKLAKLYPENEKVLLAASSAFLLICSKEYNAKYLDVVLENMMKIIKKGPENITVISTLLNNISMVFLLLDHMNQTYIEKTFILLNEIVSKSIMQNSNRQSVLSKLASVLSEAPTTYQKLIFSFLSTLSKQFPDSEEVALFVANGFMFLEPDETVYKDIEIAIEVLEHLYYRWPMNEAIAERYASGLSLITPKYKRKNDRDRAIQRTIEIGKRWSENETIAVLLSKMLTGAMLESTDYNDIEEKNTKLELLSQRWATNEIIAAYFTTSLMRYAHMHEDTKTWVTVAKHIVGFWEKWPDNEAIASVLARILAVLTSMQISPNDELAALHVLEDLSENFPNDEDISIMFAYGLSNVLLVILRFGDVYTLIDKLDNLMTRWPNNENIASAMQKVLCGAYLQEFDKDKSMSTIKRMEQIFERWPDNEDITDFLNHARKFEY